MKKIILAPIAILGFSLHAQATTSEQHYQTHTPYQPQEKLAQYEPAPTGFTPVFTEMVARHGSRGLTEMGPDLALYQLWLKAKSEHALTPLGEKLGGDLKKMMQVNILLGDGVNGIQQIGYGNESAQGALEHSGIATRLMQRLPNLFTANQQFTPRIEIETSGVNRAVDSAYFFTHALIQHNPALSANIFPSYFATTQSNTQQADKGVNRFLLYFHRLDAQQDLAQLKTPEEQQIYQDSLAYQDFKQNNPILAEKLASLKEQKNNPMTANQVLSRLFKPSFIAKIGTPNYIFKNTGSMQATTHTGERITSVGNGKIHIKTAGDAALRLYEIYQAAAGLKAELGTTEFQQYMPKNAAQFYASYRDGVDFYEKGPSFRSANGITSLPAIGLEKDFFDQVDAVVNKTQKNSAVLRFAHAEVMIPIASRFAIQGTTSLADQLNYKHQNSAWRASTISPMAANMQWDVYQNSQGKTLVKMLYNEKETAFKSSCAHAKYAHTRYFYDYQKLKQCYGYQ